MADIFNNASNAAKSLNKETSSATNNLFQFNEILKEIQPTNIFESALNINQQISNLNRQVLQRGQSTIRSLERTITDATRKTIEFGVSIDDNIQLFASLNQALKTVSFYTSSQVVDMQAIAKNTSLSAEEMGKFEEAFDTLGRNTDYMIDNLEDMSNMARSYGLNVNQFMSVIADNVKLLASYNFKNGIDGLTQMVAQAQSLRFDFNKTVDLADKLMDPEQAIEMAANFQMLGGQIGALGDPMRMLYMAQQDIGGLQDSIMEAASSAVSFNEATGEFDISVTQMYRLRTMADQLGMSYRDLAEQAIRSKQEQEKLSVIESLGTIPREYQELVKNLSEFDEGGELKIKLPNMQESIEVSRLTGKNFDELRKLQELDGKTQKEIADEQLSIQEKILAEIEGIKFEPGAAAITEAITEIQSTNKTLETVYGKMGNFVEDKLPTVISTIGDVVSNSIEEKLNVDLNKFIEDANYRETALTEQYNKVLEELGIRAETVVIKSGEFNTENPSQPENNGSDQFPQAVVTDTTSVMTESNSKNTKDSNPKLSTNNFSSKVNNYTEVTFKNQPSMDLNINVRGENVSRDVIANIIKTDSEIKGALKNMVMNVINDSDTQYG